MGWQDAPVVGQKKESWQDAPVIGQKQPRKSTARQLTDATVNTGAGLVQGFTALPDMMAQGFGAVAGGVLRAGGALGSAVGRAVGADDLARENDERIDRYASALESPTTLGGIVERYAPTPEDSVGRGVRVASQVIGALMTPTPKLAKPPVRPAAPTVTAGQKVAQAAERQNVRVLPADVGGPSVRTMTAGVAKTPYGANPIAKGAAQTADDAALAAERIANRAGPVTDTQGAGEIVQTGAKAFAKRTGETGGKLYTRAAKLAGDTKVTAPKAVDLIDENLARLTKAPNANKAEISFLQGLRADLVDDAGNLRALDIDTIRGIRSGLRTKFATEGLRGTPVEKLGKDILSAASDDIASGLQAQGKGNAAAAYKTADNFWRSRVDEIDNVLEPILGKNRSGQQVFEAVERLASSKGGDPKKLSRLMNSLGPDDAATVRATYISRLGEATPGRAAEAGEFSLQSFLTRWNKTSDRAKAVLFADKGLRSALDDLATIASGTRGSAAYANVSNTGLANAVNATNTLSVIGLASGNPLAAVILPVTQNLTGRMLASPLLVRWLTKGLRIAKTGNQSLMRSHAAQLTAVAEKQPAIANEVQALQQRLLEGLSKSPAPRAAAENEQPVGGEPPRE